jgi:radical SAM-linked protein
VPAASVAGDAVEPSGTPTAAAPRQRWRLVLARAEDAPRIAGRELTDAWEDALEATGLPVHRPTGRTRGRVAFAAPLQLGVAAERELAEVFLAERVPIWRVRDALTERLPAGWRLVDLHDVWVGGPPLAGRVVAADYRIELQDGPGPDRLAEAARSLLAARELPRVRQKGESSVTYDLRPLLVAISVDHAAVIRARTRIHPELGSGRPEEVVAALGDALGHPFEIKRIVREGLVLADDAT